MISKATTPKKSIHKRTGHHRKRFEECSCSPFRCHDGNEHGRHGIASREIRIEWKRGNSACTIPSLAIGPNIDIEGRDQKRERERKKYRGSGGD